MRLLDLFSGIGGFSLAASRAGIIPTQFVEMSRYCQKELIKNFPGVPIHEDIKTFKGQPGTADIISGGFPCQPFSTAGKRRGTKDDRALWPEMFRIIQEVRPTWVLGENVIGIENMELDQVLFDLESKGYETQSFNIPACAVDANHRRERIWIVANSNSEGFTDIQRKRVPAKTSRRRTVGAPSRWDAEPDVGRVAHGIPARVDRLKGLGNAIVPQVAYEIFKAIVEVRNADKQNPLR